MPIQCVLFNREKLQVQFKIDTPAALRETAGLWLLPAAVAVKVEELELFRKSGVLFKDRGRKDERKGLSEYLLGQDNCIPFIDANVVDPGRVIQAAERLVKNAVDANEQGIYLLGVSGELFNAVWNDKKTKTEDEALKLAFKGSGLTAVIPWQPGEAELSRYFWGYSLAYHEVRQLILYAARISDPVLILGESGTGKSVVAEAIHKLKHEDRPFIPVNCATIPSQMFELEIFGYAPGGAFRGALFKGKEGKWEEASGGTLFLDEIGELRLDNQEKILRALQEGVIRRVGALQNTPVSARVIAATNRDLYGMVQRGKFLEDLYYLLRQFLIYTPDLRGDPRNVEVIAQKLWREISDPNAWLSKDILDDLCRHPWPGNVSELRSVLRSLYNFYGSSAPTCEQLNAVFQHFGLAAGYGQRDPEAGEPALLHMECLRKICRVDDAIHACEQELKPLAAGLPLNVAARDSLTRMRVELQTLMRDRLYFGSQETYQAVAHVEESLEQLLALPKKETPALSSFLQKTLAPDIQQAVALLFAELKKLRASMNTGTGMDSSSA
jgi:DNA-binding NtrC family response regulator